MIEKGHEKWWPESQSNYDWDQWLKQAQEALAKGE